MSNFIISVLMTIFLIFIIILGIFSVRNIFNTQSICSETCQPYTVKFCGSNEVVCNGVDGGTILPIGK